MKKKNQIVGTGIFSYKEKCQDCKKLRLVDINGFCKDCYIEDVEKEMEKEDNLVYKRMLKEAIKKEKKQVRRLIIP